MIKALKGFSFGRFNNLATLIKMQLKEQLNFKRLDVENVKTFHIAL